MTKAPLDARGAAAPKAISPLRFAERAGWARGPPFPFYFFPFWWDSSGRTEIIGIRLSVRRFEDRQSSAGESAEKLSGWRFEDFQRGLADLETEKPVVRLKLG